LARKPPPKPAAPPAAPIAAPKKTGRRGGRRPGAGRPKGATNKRTAAMIAEAQAKGILPHDFLTAIMRGEPMQCSLFDDVTGLPLGDPITCYPTLDQRIDAAKAAAPYFAHRLASIEHTGKIGVTRDASELSDDELAAIAAGDGDEADKG
jgi:hypothetical protein